VKESTMSAVMLPFAFMQRLRPSSSSSLAQTPFFSVSSRFLSASSPAYRDDDVNGTSTPVVDDPLAFRNTTRFVVHPPVGVLRINEARFPTPDVGSGNMLRRILYLHGPLTADQCWRLCELESERRFKLAESLSKDMPKYAFLLGDVIHTKTHMKQVFYSLKDKKVAAMTDHESAYGNRNLGELREQRRALMLDLDSKLEDVQDGDVRVSDEIASADTVLADVVAGSQYLYYGVPDMRFIRKERSTLAKEMLRPLRLDTDYAKYKANDGGVVGNIRRGLDVLFGTEDEPKQPRKQGA